MLTSAVSAGEQTDAWWWFCAVEHGLIVFLVMCGICSRSLPGVLVAVGWQDRLDILGLTPYPAVGPTLSCCGKTKAGLSWALN